MRERESGMKRSSAYRRLAVIGLLACAGIATSIQPSLADAPTVPTIVSFTMSPNSVDIATTNTTVTFDLIVTNPTGIASLQSQVTLTDGINNTLLIPMVRTDLPVNNTLQTVEFRGLYAIPSNLTPGVYTATASPIAGLTATGGQGFSTQSVSATTTSTVLGASNALLVRSGGYLNFAYSTFTGPSFATNRANIFVNPKYNSVTAPIWKVGEKFNPSDYYELKVPTLSLKMKTSTPAICTTDGKILSLISSGICGFTVYTDKSLDYQMKEDVEVVTVGAARTKPVLTVGTISTQSSATLPLSIQGPFIYGTSGLVIPVSATPTVCYPVGSYITVISGGTCTLNYSTPATADYLASDIMPLTFQISRTAQTLTFTPPATAAVAGQMLTLSATASSGAPVTFQSNSPTICSVTGNSLNLLAVGSCEVAATQAGTTTISSASVIQTIAVTGSIAPLAKPPIVKKSVAKKIVCIKKGKSRVFTGTKCPAGYKAQKP